jgi:glutathione synthase/RimK-type ligase-like ATP-grasp enzyme
MKNVVFVKGGDIWKGDPVKKEALRKSYEILFEMGKKEGLFFAWTSLNYFKRNSFSAYAYFDGEKWKKKRKPLRPDFIIDKSHFKFENFLLKKSFDKAAPLLNALPASLIASDKFLTHLIFPEFTKRNWLVHNLEEINEALKQIKTRRVVVKSPYGFGGKTVEILSKAQCKKLKLTEPTLFQEFIDSSKGIPGIVEGMHDFRVICLGSKMVTSYVRTPPKGKLLSNWSGGGSLDYIPLKDVPKKVKAITNSVLKRLELLPNTLYTVDFMYENGKTPYLIEMNNNPTFQIIPGYEKEATHFYKMFIKHVQKFV